MRSAKRSASWLVRDWVEVRVSIAGSVSCNRPIQSTSMSDKLYWHCNGHQSRVCPMNWQEFTALLVMAAAMSFSPGPNTTLSATLAANGGLPRAMRFVLAVPVGWTLLLALCAAGVGA